MSNYVSLYGFNNSFSQDVNANNKKITNLANGVLDSDAINKL